MGDGWFAATENSDYIKAIGLSNEIPTETMPEAKMCEDGRGSPLI